MKNRIPCRTLYISNSCAEGNVIERLLQLFDISNLLSTRPGEPTIDAQESVFLYLVVSTKKYNSGGRPRHLPVEPGAFAIKKYTTQ